MSKSTKNKNIICICAIVILFCLGEYVHVRRVTHSFNNSIENEQSQITYYRGQKEHIQMSHVKKKSIVIEKHIPDLHHIITSNNHSINKGLNVAFNHCHTVSQFNRNRALINSNLGTSVGQKVQQVIKPVSNKGSMKPISDSSHLLWSKIGYGPITNKTQIPVTVVLMYRTPSTYVLNGKGTSDSVSHYIKGSYKASSKVKVVLDLRLDVHSKQLTYNQGFQVSANNEQ